MGELDSVHASIDHEYERFVVGLREGLQGVARHLPLRVGLTSRAGVGWSEAVEEPLILALPSLLLTAIRPPATPELVTCAQRVHLYAMLGALVLAQADRGAVELDAELEELLGQFERQRHRAVAELRLLGAEQGSSFTLAEREARGAAAQELAALAGEDRVEVATCVAVHTRKSGLAFPATMAAAAAAGLDAEGLAHVHDFVLGAILGIGFHREVTELADRARAQRSWVVALSRERGQPAAIGELLHLAIDAFDRASAAASVLGADALRRWAEQRREQVTRFARAEAAAGRASLPTGSPASAA